LKSPKVVFLNGPPRCGKDFGGLLLEDLGYSRYKIARVLKESTHGLFGLAHKHDYYEDVKDQPLADFHFITPREAYIAASENFWKPTFGEDILGRRLLKEMMQDDLPGRQFVITDAGFAKECMPIVGHFGPENCLLVRIHRAGHDFSGDSRGYISLGYDVRTVDLTNDKTFATKLPLLVTPF
jgi:hypothetical protein